MVPGGTTACSPFLPAPTGLLQILALLETPRAVPRIIRDDREPDARDVEL